MTGLTKKEKKILGSFERGEGKSLGPRATKKHIKMARAHIKEKRINLRVADEVLDQLKKAALQEGIPYQTLISSVLYRYAHGVLYDTRHILKALKLLQAA